MATKKKVWLTIKEAAPLLKNVTTGKPSTIGLTVQRVRRLLQTGQLQGERDPNFGYWVVSREEITRFNRLKRKGGWPKGRKRTNNS